MKKLLFSFIIFLSCQTLASVEPIKEEEVVIEIDKGGCIFCTEELFIKTLSLTAVLDAYLSEDGKYLYLILDPERKITKETIKDTINSTGYEFVSFN